MNWALLAAPKCQDTHQITTIFPPSVKDALLLVLVLGVVVLALAVDVAAIVGWLRRSKR